MKQLVMITLCSLAAWPARAIEMNVEIDAGEQRQGLLRGDWPEEVESLSLDLKDSELREAVETIADQAGWGLVFTASKDQAKRHVTMRLKNIDADRALELVLKGSGLEARLDDDILVVTELGGASDDPEVTRVKVPLGDIEVDVKKGSEHGRSHRGGKDERTAIGQSLVIAPGEHVDGDAVAVGGNLTVSAGASIDGDAVAVGGSVHIMEGAQVDGQAVAVGGTLTVDDGATVDGDQVAIGGTFGGLISTLVEMGTDKPTIPGFLFSLLASIVRILALLVLGVLLLSFAPERVDNARAFLQERPGHSVLAGLAVLVGFVPLCILLAITVIGIPLIPIVALILAAVMVIGMTAFCTWLGDRIPLFKDHKSRAGALAIGLAVVFLVDLIPVIGGTAIMVVSFIAAGATLLSRVGKRKPEPTMPKDVAEAI